MGKQYDTKFIREFIEQNKDAIESITCGMKEDWDWTATTVYDNGEYQKDLTGETIELKGICGSTWATPVMEVSYKDGRSEDIACHKSDGETASENLIRQQKAFVTATGGGPK